MSDERKTLTHWGKLAAEIAKEPPLTDEEFFEVLERSAPDDPVIQELVRKAREEESTEAPQ